MPIHEPREPSYNVEPKMEKETCRKCGADYEARVFYLFGHRYCRGVCPACSEKLVADERMQQEADRQAAIAEQRRRWRLASGIPDRYQSEDLTTFDTGQPGNVADVHRRCSEYAEGFPVTYDEYVRRTGKAYPSLVLFSAGVWGLGKTHLACSIAHRVLDRWQGEPIACPVKVVSEPRLYASLQATYNYTPEQRLQLPGAQAIMNSLFAVRLLIIDDVGKEPRQDMDFVRRTLFAIVDARYNQLRPVVITTNRDHAELKHYLGGNSDEATLDRLIEMCQGRFIRVTGKSYRRRE